MGWIFSIFIEIYWNLYEKLCQTTSNALFDCDIWKMSHSRKTSFTLVVKLLHENGNRISKYNHFKLYFLCFHKKRIPIDLVDFYFPTNVELKFIFTIAYQMDPKCIFERVEANRHLALVWFSKIYKTDIWFLWVF